uniref:Uncharacterized protein C1orf43 homolog n=2 Tax=Schistocephalus solidus TaxID=70667 RepID=A0A0V0J307_SCHSO
MSGQTIALSWFLILLAIGAIIFLSVIIVVKRSISRRKGRIGKIIYTPCGHGAPNIWKDLVHKKINATVEVRTEPRVLGPMSSDGLCSNPTNQVLGFRFRAKTVDLFVDLKESILLSFPDLEAPPIRNIRDFLMAARMKAMHPTAPRDIVDSYCKLYMRARHDPGPYTEADYFTFVDLHDQLIKRVIRKDAAPCKPSKSISRATSSKSEPSDVKLAKLPSVSAGLRACSDRHRKLATYQQMESADDNLALASHIGDSSPLEIAQFYSRTSTDDSTGILPVFRGRPVDSLQMRVIHDRGESSNQDGTKSFPHPAVTSVSGNPFLPYNSTLVQPLGGSARPALSRSSSAASDDSQTALICLENSRTTAGRVHELPNHG